MSSTSAAVACICRAFNPTVRRNAVACAEQLSTQAFVPAEHTSGEGAENMDSWVYFAGLYESKFEAYCAVMWVEADERIRGAATPDEVQVYQTRHGKYGVRFRSECG